MLQLVLAADGNQVELVLEVLLLDESLGLVEVTLSPIASLRLGPRVLYLVGSHALDPTTLRASTTSGWSPARSVVTVVEVIKVVEHEVHVLTFLVLKVVHDALVLLNLNLDVGISGS